MNTISSINTAVKILGVLCILRKEFEGKFSQNSPTSHQNKYMFNECKKT